MRMMSPWRLRSPTRRSGNDFGDRNYHSPRLAYEFEQRGLELATPPKKRSGRADTSWTASMTQRRRRIETVIGQLA